MADTASLVVRVSATGVEDLSKKLDNVSSSATKADNSINTFTADTTKSSTAAAKAGGAFSGFGSKAAQVGYQVQDMTVQLQAGTSAFTVIAQQVPQALGAFGPMGAIIGTVTALAAAVGGVLYKSMQDTAQSAEALKDAQKLLNSTMEEGSDGALHLSDAFYQLAASNEEAARAQLNAAIAAATVKMKAAGKAANDAGEELDSFLQSMSGTTLSDAATQLNKWTNEGKSAADISKELSSSITAFDASTAVAVSNTTAVTGYLANLSTELGLNNDQALKLAIAMSQVAETKSPEAVKALGAELTLLQATNGTANDKLTEFTNTVMQAVVEIQKGGDAIAFLRGRLQSLHEEAGKAKNRMAALGESYVANLEMQNKKGADLLKAQRDMQIKEIKNKEGLDDAQRARALAATEQYYQNELADLKNAENKKTETHAAALQKREDTAQRHREREAEREKQAAERFIAQVERTSSDELANIEATKAQRLATLEKYHNTEITDQETGKKVKLISDQQYADLSLDIEKTATENRIKEIDRRNAEILKKKTEHDQFMKEIQMSGNSAFDQIEAEANANRAKANELYQSGVITSAEEHRAALAAIDKKAMDDKLSEYSSGMGDLSSNLKTALGEQSAAYKAAATLQATINMYKSAQSSFAFGSEIGGPILGGAFAAVAVAAGLKNIAGINAAREQGGSMSANSAYQMAERGKAEVIVPAGASRARTAAQMRDIMGQNSGGSQIRGVTIINNTTGRIDSAQTEVDNEDQLRVIIDEHVSNMLMTQDSRIAKARRASVGPGY